MRLKTTGRKEVCYDEIRKRNTGNGSYGKQEDQPVQFQAGCHGIHKGFYGLRTLLSDFHYVREQADSLSCPTQVSFEMAESSETVEQLRSSYKKSVENAMRKLFKLDKLFFARYREHIVDKLDCFEDY